MKFRYGNTGIRQPRTALVFGLVAGCALAYLATAALAAQSRDPRLPRTFAQLYARSAPGSAAAMEAAFSRFDDAEYREQYPSQHGSGIGGPIKLTATGFKVMDALDHKRVFASYDHFRFNPRGNITDYEINGVRVSQTARKLKVVATAPGVTVTPLGAELGRKGGTVYLTIRAASDTNYDAYDGLLEVAGRQLVVGDCDSPRVGNPDDAAGTGTLHAGQAIKFVIPFCGLGNGYTGSFLSASTLTIPTSQGGDMLAQVQIVPRP